MSSTLPIPPPAFDRTGVYARFGSIEDITPQFIRDNYLKGLGYLPQLFNVDYRAGFEKGTIPQIFIDAVAKLAVINIFSTIGESVYPTGVSSQSFGIDGMSQSRGYVKGGEFAPIFSGTINQYQRELLGDPRLGTPGLLHDIRNYYRGVNMTVTA
jgi:hypothetical protein